MRAAVAPAAANDPVGAVSDRGIRHRARIDAFVADLSALFRTSTLDALQSVIGDAPAARTAPPSIAAPASQRGRKAKGGTRSTEAVLEMTATVHAYITSHKGERLDQIAKGLGVPTKELKLPAQKLFAHKAIKTTGVRRGTVSLAKKERRESGTRPDSVASLWKARHRVDCAGRP